jgi:hypothetical protein
MTEQKEKAQQKQIAQRRLYRVLAGAHQERDYSAKPRRMRVQDPETGEFAVEERYPSKTFTAGQVLESEHNLVDLFGANKFQEVVKRGRRYESVTEREDEDDTYQRADPTPLNAQAPRTAPHGQVYQGHPATSGADGPINPDSGVRQYAQTPEEAREIAEKHADRLPQPKEEKPKFKQRQRQAEQKQAKAAGRPRTAKSAPAREEEEADFHAMKKDELIAYAEENEIDLGDATLKEDIVKKLERSRR